MFKIKLELDGWHLLSKKQQIEIIKIARSNFQNANFSDGNGLLIEGEDQYSIHKFCLDILSSFKTTLHNNDGYKIKCLSTKISNNFADRKRKLEYNYFKSLILENDISKAKFVIAGILYLDPDDLYQKLIDIEYEETILFSQMSDEQLKSTYKKILLYSASKDKLAI